MPELPEVETMRRGLLPIVGRRVADAQRLACPRKPIAVAPRIDHLRRRIVGQQVAAIERVGKRVVVVFDDSGDRLVIEPRMTGLVLVADPPDPLYLRLRIDLAGRGIPSFYYWDRRGLGNVRLFSAEEFATEFGPDRLGPDALAMTADEYRTRLRSSRRAVKVALLDQRVVAGIGNLYASELLHVAAIHPAKRCDRLTRGDWQRLAEASLAVLEEAIRYEGSTLGDGTYRNALNKDGSYQNMHRVYARQGTPCPRCGQVIERIVQAQRATFFCAGCQKKR
ncbi:Fpg/Nei family DNA glycosylase [Aeoliella mucimassa]|uniref:Formamidopyrimidine-DNA glycosylase n=1 Tax=Aeoliella mucimassa TaxID=2527972 RepID=A0A518AI43_9BACT|nr:DNA-formamidopyrimidine glycosylase family protein [Aeoliella mucimassa]QDU54344.1 Formamidopyrimidine-DNA glycosylase [Aeoliella mucimassa]